MPMEIKQEAFTCYRCGKVYPKRTFFPTSYAQMHKGMGRLPVCKDCTEALYFTYLEECKNAKDATRQLCRKLDIFWSEKLFDSVSARYADNNLIFQYIDRTSKGAYAGKSYEDTLRSAGTLWDFVGLTISKQDEEEPSKDNDIPDDVIAYWGSGQTREMYEQLEQRRAYFIKKYPDAFSEESDDIGNDILMRQMCNLEVLIAKDSAQGKSVDKYVNSLNTLLGSLNMKPAQKKNDDADQTLNNTPLGVWIRRWEDNRPLPKVEESEKDVRHIKKYIFTWMGHLCKMLGIKNGYTRLYEEEIARLRVERPEYEEEDDETLLIDSYSDGDPDD